jgi:hypothetical protein
MNAESLYSDRRTLILALFDEYRGGMGVAEMLCATAMVGERKAPSPIDVCVQRLQQMPVPALADDELHQLVRTLPPPPHIWGGA